MQSTPQSAEQKNDEQNATPAGGLPVRTDLRAGLAWDDLDDQAKNLWDQISASVSNLTGGGDTTTAA